MQEKIKTMKNIHILPTEKPSRIYMNLGQLFLEQEYSTSKGESLNHNIYITSDEEIKEGNWVLFSDRNLLYKVEYTSQCFDYNNDEDCKKIILTTDQDLIKDGVQAIDDDFLEWFVKNRNYEWVEVEKDNHLFCKHCDTLHSTFRDGVNCDVCRRESNPYSKILGYKIIIPKEEPKQETQGYICPQTKKQCDDECCVSAKDCHLEASIGVLSEPKQETLEEAAENHINNFKYTKHIGYEGFIAGAKWQQERMYSEEEVKKLIELHSDFIDSKIDYEGINNATTAISNPEWNDEEWFEQFKKK